MEGGIGRQERQAFRYLNAAPRRRRRRLFDGNEVQDVRRNICDLTISSRTNGQVYRDGVSDDSRGSKYRSTTSGHPAIAGAVTVRSWRRGQQSSAGGSTLFLPPAGSAELPGSAVIALQRLSILEQERVPHQAQQQERRRGQPSAACGDDNGDGNGNGADACLCRTAADW
jgi:hypothetical protein